MPTKWTPGHYVIVALGALMAVLTYLSSDPVLGVYAKPALTILTVLMGYFGLTTGKAMNGPAGPTGPALVMLLAFGLMRCSWLRSPQGAASVTAGIDLAICALDHSSEPIAQIVTDCGASTAEDVIKILDAHTAAMQRAGK
jgi:small neutral amino acid transporter SnatA (MarC family)